MKKSKLWKRKTRGQTRGSPKNPFYWFSKKGKMPDDDEAGIIKLTLGKQICSSYFNTPSTGHTTIRNKLVPEEMDKVIPEEIDTRLSLAKHTPSGVS